MNKISVIIPAFNEEAFIENALKSASFADEILVLDSGSTDKTVDLAAKYNARIIKYQWQGFKYSHELGTREATSDWVFFLDADERISRDLRIKLLDVLSHPKADAYQVVRQNYIMGQALKHGGWYPDQVTRLINRHRLVRWVGQLHEYPQIDGHIGSIDSPIYHLTHRNLDWMMEKSSRYTKLQAQIALPNHPKVRVRNFFGAMAREFWYRAVRQAGWKDGLVGWLEIIYQTFNAFLVQVHIWEMQRKKPLAQIYQDIDERISREF